MFHNEQTDKELGKIRDIHINTLSNAIPVIITAKNFVTHFYR